jgi:hypothetical protein
MIANPLDYETPKPQRNRLKWVIPLVVFVGATCALVDRAAEWYALNRSAVGQFCSCLTVYQVRHLIESIVTCVLGIGLGISTYVPGFRTGIRCKAAALILVAFALSNFLRLLIENSRESWWFFGWRALCWSSVAFVMTAGSVWSKYSAKLWRR